MENPLIVAFHASTSTISFMPPLKNLKHEAFAQGYVKTLASPSLTPNGTAAYQAVYGASVARETARVSASKLLHSSNVGDRVRELITQHNQPDAIGRDLAKLRQHRRGIYWEGRKIATEPDGPTRLGAVNAVLRVYGLGESAPAIDARAVHFALNCDVSQLATIAQTLDRLSARLTPGFQSSNMASAPANLSGGGGEGGEGENLPPAPQPDASH